MGLLLGSVVLGFYGWLWYFLRSRLRSRGLQLPPGPTRKWLTGNLHQIPRIEPWLTFTSWAKTYGPIVHYSVFGTHTILLNTGKAASDLLESRSAIYSDRPKFWMLGVLAGRIHSVFHASTSNPRFKVMRKLLQTGLNPRAAKGYRHIQTQETMVLLKALLTTPNDFGRHIRRNAVAVILKIAYGYQVDQDDDPLVHLLEDGFRLSATISVPGKYWIEFMPILRFVPDWFPGAKFKRKAKHVRAELAKMEASPFDWAIHKIISGDFVESFTSIHLFPENGEVVDDETQKDIKWASAALFVGGGDTTVSALLSFILLMALYPEVQRRAQADIDRIAPGRLPTLDDYDALPYVRAIIKEVLRWAPVAPLGLVHRVTEDDVYETYFIPKGSKIIANIWAITHDEEIYMDPYTFDPTRHLGEKPQVDPLKFVFGFGRRVCPGAHLAEMSLFLNIACILSVYNVSKAVDANGAEIEPIIEWTSGVTRHLKPFQCQIKPRSDTHILLLDGQE